MEGRMSDVPQALIHVQLPHVERTGHRLRVETECHLAQTLGAARDIAFGRFGVGWLSEGLAVHVLVHLRTCTVSTVPLTGVSLLTVKHLSKSLPMGIGIFVFMIVSDCFYQMVERFRNAGSARISCPVSGQIGRREDHLHMP